MFTEHCAICRYWSEYFVSNWITCSDEWMENVRNVNSMLKFKSSIVWKSKLMPIRWFDATTVICTKQQFQSNKMKTTVKWLSDWSFWTFQHAINCIQAINFQSGAQQRHMLPTPILTYQMYKMQIIFCLWKHTKNLYNRAVVAIVWMFYLLKSENNFPFH